LWLWLWLRLPLWPQRLWLRLRRASQTILALIIAGKHIKTMQKMLGAECCVCICRLLQCHVAQLLIFRWVQ